MAKNQAAESANTENQKALEQRVEVIMGNAPVSDAATTNKTTPAIDIFKDPKTAPAVSEEVLKEVGADTQPEVAPETPSEPPINAGESIAETETAEDPETAKAVNDIVAKESDETLAREDAEIQKDAQSLAPKATGWKAKLKRFLKSKWTWLTVVVLLVVVFALPFTRYTILGLFLKQSVAITVTDSTTRTAVSNAVVSAEGVTAKTNAQGKVSLKVPVGKTNITVKKQYYKTTDHSYFVGLKSGQSTNISLQATGRQVHVTVVNKITGKSLANAEIQALGTTAKTDDKGQTTIVLPANTKSKTAIATVTLKGYNTAQAELQITSSLVPANTVAMTPSGQIYFLSNLSGTIDVVKTNLDGTGRKTVFAGTGREDKNSTSLLASRDWRYLVLKSARNSTQPSLYLIDTSNDKVISFDSGNADFSLIGWYGHYFVYDVIRNTVPDWQNAHQVVKSYNADSGRLNQIDQTAAEGSSDNYGYQQFGNYYLVDGTLTYTTQWYANSSLDEGYNIDSKKATIRGIQPSGASKKDYQTINNKGLSYIQAALYEPQGVYYETYNYLANKSTFYKYEEKKVSAVTNISQGSVNQAYPTYLLSPSGKQTFWAELRDGKNALFLGDDNAGNKKQIATLSEYAPYGWFSDDYLLISKSESELYVVPADTLSTSQKLLKITDYYKPAQSYNGYGYGYGGL